MRPSRTLLSLISSLVFCIVVWTSDVHALSVKVEVLDPVNNNVLTTANISFTTIATNSPGCLSGFVCNGVSGWSGGGNGTLSYNGSGVLNGSGAVAIRISTSAGFTSGPIASVSDGANAAGFGLNGMIFQGFSTAGGRLRITFDNNFINLTDSNTRTYGFMESGSFLQPNALTGSNTCISTPTQCGNVSGDTLNMQGTVDSTLFPGTPILKTAGSGVSSPYSFNLSPTAVIPTTIAGGTLLKYTWVYNYTNTGGPVTSKFSDNGEDDDNPLNCLLTPADPACIIKPGGLGIYDAPAGDPIIATITAGVLPEPSSVLLLGLGLLSGGIFFASRLRKEKERETR